MYIYTEELNIHEIYLLSKIGLLQWG
jgi:hypothetical protein